MVEHSGVVWPPLMWPTLALEVWDKGSSVPVVSNYFKIATDQYI
jgi:hypothetical protein